MNKTSTFIASLIIIVVIGFVVFSNPATKIKSGVAAISQEQKEGDIEYAKPINLYIWDEYITDKAISRFKSKYGIDVNLHYFEDENEILSILLSTPIKVDVCVVSGAMLKELRGMKLLAPLDHSTLSNIGNLDEKFLNPTYDPGNRYSIPYMWGTTGLVINRKYIKTNNPDWTVLFEKQYADHIAFISNPYECFSIPLLIKGYNLNTQNLNEIKEAAEILNKTKNTGVKILGEVDIAEGIRDETIWAAATYSGLVTEQVENNPDVEFIHPNQGYNLWVDNLCIPRSSSKKETAQLFINHILDPKISSEITNTLYAANTNAAAKKYINQDILNNRYLYPPASVQEKAQSFGYQYSNQNVNKIINKTWHNLTSE